MISNIFIFSIAYYCIPSSISKKEVDFLKCAYFSVVTFVTLGCGDYSPISESSKIFADLEGVLGIVLIALFFVTLPIDTKEINVY